MRIGMISTYPPIECGIATYTQYLVKALRKLNNELYIVSQFGGEGEKVYPVFHADDADLSEKIFRVMVKFTPDVVHIQHEYGLFGSSKGVNVIPLLYKFKLAKIPVVITLHTVYETFSREEKIILEALVRAADAVIVHEEYQKEVLLKEISFSNNIWVIPHGCREVKLVPGAKQMIGIGKHEKSILLCGYFRPNKGMKRIVKIFPRIVDKVKNAVLVIAGKIRQQEFSEYRDDFLRLVNDSPQLEKIKVLRGQFPQETLDTIISSADVIPLLYRTGSQSGILAHCLAFGRPVVVSPEVRALRELVEKSRCGLIANSDAECAEHIARILNDDNFHRQLSNNALNYVRDVLAWPLVAKQATEVYRKVVSVPYGKARYIQL